MIERRASHEIEPQFVKDALMRLVSVGLTLESLAKRGRIVDIGAKDCAIQRAAEYYGMRNVVSVDRHIPDAVRETSLQVLENDASSLDLQEGSVDLLVVRSSAYFYTKTEGETLQILHETNRVLKPQGEQRVYPARFGHVIEQLLKEYPEFSAAKSVSPERCSKQQLNLIEFYYIMANNQSLDFLKARGVPARKAENAEPYQRAAFREYLIIPKF